MCLVDKNGTLRQTLQILEESDIDRRTTENIEQVYNNFLNAFLFGINVWKRGEHARALECLYYTQRYYLQLIRITEKTTNHWVNPFTQLENELSNKAYESFKKGTAPLENEAIHEAYIHLLKSSKKIIKQLEQEYSVTDFTQIIKEIEVYSLEN